MFFISINLNIDDNSNVCFTFLNLILWDLSWTLPLICCLKLFASHIAEHVSAPKYVQAEIFWKVVKFHVNYSLQPSTFSVFWSLGIFAKFAQTQNDRYTDKKEIPARDVNLSCFEIWIQIGGWMFTQVMSCLIQNPFHNIISFRHLFVWTRISSRTM